MNAKEEAEKLLPCHCTAGGHHPHCIGNYHKAVATALGARDKEIAELRTELAEVKDYIGELRSEIVWGLKAK